MTLMLKLHVRDVATATRQCGARRKTVPMTIAPASAGVGQKTVAQVLGEVVWLMSQSQVHKQLFVGDLEWFCMPPILLEQFRMFHGQDRPAAVVFWAKVNAETEARLMAGGGRLRPDEWNNGDRHWLIELVAPFGAEAEILSDLQSSVFLGKTFKFHRTTPQGQREVAVIEPLGAGATFN